MGVIDSKSPNCYNGYEKGDRAEAGLHRGEDPLFRVKEGGPR